MLQTKVLIALAALSFRQVVGIDLDLTDTDSIKKASVTITTGLVSYYNGENATDVPGLLPKPYLWWEGAAMFDTLIQYWHSTGDDQYNDMVGQGLLFQQGQNQDFQPQNQSKDSSNDDISAWALAAMSAAEAQFSEPEDIAWVTLAENAFQAQVYRWDTETCGGGLHWQVAPASNGFTYKSTTANGYFFLLASRLARYTGESTYSDWAAKAFDWTVSVGLVGSNWNVFDGTDSLDNCTVVNNFQFSNNAAAFISGVANLYNITTGDSQAKWKSSLDGLLEATLDTFFPNGIATEVSCEARDTCNTDMKAYKGLLARSLVETIKLAPYTAANIKPLLSTSAEAAAKSCDGAKCGHNWNSQKATATESSEPGGLSNDISALSYVQALLVEDSASPVTSNTGANNSSSAGGSGTTTSGSKSTGTPSSTSSLPAAPLPTGAAIRIGAERLSMDMVAGMIGVVGWLFV